MSTIPANDDGVVVYGLMFRADGSIQIEWSEAGDINNGVAVTRQISCPAQGIPSLGDVIEDFHQALTEALTYLRNPPDTFTVPRT